MIAETFVMGIFKAEYPMNYQTIYDKSNMFQYLDKKMKAVYVNSKTRKSLSNIYAVYFIIFFCQNDFYKKTYHQFGDYDYMYDNLIVSDIITTNFEQIFTIYSLDTIIKML